jgi:hypothetical protein
LRPPPPRTRPRASSRKPNRSPLPALSGSPFEAAWRFRWRATTQLELVARCLSPEAALRFEQSFRALVSLTIGANARQPTTAGMLHSIRIGREERVVHVSLSAPLDALGKLLFQ